MNLPDELRAGLDQALEGFPPKQIAAAVGRLIERYRGSAGTGESLASTDLELLAYAAYRMPATYAAAWQALDRTALVLPEFTPRRQLDIGGGTGSALWAATDVWPSLQELSVMERSPVAVELGRRLASRSASPAVRETHWQRATLDPTTPLPAVDLVTMSFVLGELPERTREPIVRWLAADAEVVGLVEPGTPDGYARIVAARDTLIDAGLTVVAPCPHDETCPVAALEDWCHFSVRLERTWLHRYVKAGSLGFEDEKFSYVVAARPALLRGARPDNRVLRHPHKRKGHLSLTLCTSAGAMEQRTVAKSAGQLYRAARNTSWGDEWPPVEQDSGIEQPSGE